MNRFVSIAILSLAIALGSGPTQATDTVSPGQLPDALQGMWRNYQPDLGELGRCAVAYDSHSDRDKMVFTCSVTTKSATWPSVMTPSACAERRGRCFNSSNAARSFSGRRTTMG